MGWVLTCDLRTARGLARAARWADTMDGPSAGSGPDVTFVAAADGTSDVRLDLPDGRVLWNARAIAELTRGSAWAWLVRRSWLAAELADLGWRLGRVFAPVAALSSPILRGPSLVPPRLVATRALVLRVIGLATVCAAWSWGAQALGLVGEYGIAPAADWLEAVAALAEQEGESAFMLAPTWLWLDASDAAIGWTVAITALAGVMLVLGWLPGPAAVVGFAGYLSLVVTGDVFMGYQWDALLLEALVLAALLAPWSRPSIARARDRAPPVSAVVLVRVVAFKLYFMSGVVKIASGDPVWADWTALDYHLWTQPLPSPTSFVLLDAPPWLLAGLTAFTLVCELVLPWALLLPASLRRVRVGATLVMLMLQVGIAATGNFGYFNILSFALVAAGLDDDALRWGRRARTWTPRARPRTSAWPPWLARVSRWPRGALVLGLMAVTLFEVRQVWLADPPPALVRDVMVELAPFRISNTYGLFANMTTGRPEIEIQGSDDGREWYTYDFAWKPDSEHDAPRFAGPHMPRLDWQLWFAALAGDCQHLRWYPRLLKRLLDGSPEVLALLADDSPFRHRPPEYVRSLVWDYVPAPPDTNIWWLRQDPHEFCPDVTWRKGRLQRVYFGPPPTRKGGDG